jgi:hypothetical protein
LCQWSNSLSSCRSEAGPREVEAPRGGRSRDCDAKAAEGVFWRL